MKADTRRVVRLVSSVLCMTCFFWEGTVAAGGRCGFVGQSGCSQLHHHCPSGISSPASTNRLCTASLPGRSFEGDPLCSQGGGG